MYECLHSQLRGGRASAHKLYLSVDVCPVLLVYSVFALISLVLGRGQLLSVGKVVNSDGQENI